MEFKGTKGKWGKIYKNRVYYIVGDKNVLVAEIDFLNELEFHTPTKIAIEANAKLIASAPEMFAILKTLNITNHEIPKWLVDEINELLTKITE